MELKQRAFEVLGQNEQAYFTISDAIWDYAELAYEEEKSAALQADYMERRGFRVTRGAGDVPNAIVAEWGEGGPVIGIFGEYDALPSTSQEADVAEFRPIVEGASGHACGHHLLGTGAMAAVDALKVVLTESGLPGTVRYYGCPAEEYGSGKAFMGRAGLFRDVDIALCWHPDEYTMVTKSGTLAVVVMRYVFHGITANPAHSGHLGRSALDAAELMGVGVQYLREHVTSDVRLHYAYQNSGGKAANVIPSKVEMNLYVRASTMDTAMEVKARVDKIAQGAALMTETRVDCILHGALGEYYSNPTVEAVIRGNLEEIPLPVYTEEELAYAAGFRQATLDGNLKHYRKILETLMGFDAERLDRELKKPVSDILINGGFSDGSSTDFGDVSQMVPSGQFRVTCYTLACPCHSWQACAVGKSSIAHKGELHAAKVLAATALDFLTNPTKVGEAKESFRKQFGNRVYECVIPPEILPHGYEF